MKRRLTQRVTLRLSIKEFSALEALAEKENDRSASALARRVILRYIRTSNVAAATTDPANARLMQNGALV
jgi:hypothetical protein